MTDYEHLNRLVERCDDLEDPPRRPRRRRPPGRGTVSPFAKVGAVLAGLAAVGFFLLGATVISAAADFNRGNPLGFAYLMYGYGWLVVPLCGFAPVGVVLGYGAIRSFGGNERAIRRTSALAANLGIVVAVGVAICIVIRLAAPATLIGLAALPITALVSATLLAMGLPRG